MPGYSVLRQCLVSGLYFLNSLHTQTLDVPFGGYDLIFNLQFCSIQIILGDRSHFRVIPRNVFF